MKLLILSVVLLSLILSQYACDDNSTDTASPFTVDQAPRSSITNPTETSAPEKLSPDDVLPAPAMGPAYRANIEQWGVDNPWPPIEVADLVLGESTSELQVTYRDHIETKASETRHNILGFHLPNVDWDDRSSQVSELNLDIDIVGLSSGITVTQDMIWYGPPGLFKVVLEIDISAYVKKGEYDFGILIEIDGKDYSSIPCTIKVNDHRETNSPTTA